jgi:hypothetical protein
VCKNASANPYYGSEDSSQGSPRKSHIEVKAPCFPEALTTTSSVDELDLANLDFEGIVPDDTGRLAYHLAILLKIYIYGSGRLSSYFSSLY